MSFRSFIPKRGDLIHLNLSPSAGHEMALRHYAIVLSPLEYNRKSRMAIICPITSRSHGWPFEVDVAEGLLPEKAGAGAVSSVVVADGVRQVDYREREAAFVAAAPPELLAEVIDKLLTLIDIPS